MSVDVEVYEDEGGSPPFDVWFDALPATHAAKVTTAIVRLGGGARSGLKPVGQGVSEWRIDWGPGIRIYLAFDGTKLVILLGGGTKTRQQSAITRRSGDGPITNAARRRRSESDAPVAEFQGDGEGARRA